jgi:hypothetical protein
MTASLCRFSALKLYSAAAIECDFLHIGQMSYSAAAALITSEHWPQIEHGNAAEQIETAEVAARERENT